MLLASEAKRSLAPLLPAPSFPVPRARARGVNGTLNRALSHSLNGSLIVSVIGAVKAAVNGARWKP